MLDSAIRLRIRVRKMRADLKAFPCEVGTGSRQETRQYKESKAFHAVAGALSPGIATARKLTACERPVAAPRAAPRPAPAARAIAAAPRSSGAGRRCRRRHDPRGRQP